MTPQVNGEDVSDEEFLYLLGDHKMSRDNIMIKFVGGPKDGDMGVGTINSCHDVLTFEWSDGGPDFNYVRDPADVHKYVPARTREGSRE